MYVGLQLEVCIFGARQYVGSHASEGVCNVGAPVKVRKHQSFAHDGMVFALFVDLAMMSERPVPLAIVQVLLFASAKRILHVKVHVAVFCDAAA